MVSLFVGDRILCHLKDNKIASAYDVEFDKEMAFDVISLYNEGYFLYIPLYMYIDEMVEITTANCNKYNVAKKFIGSNACHISDFKIIKVYERADGMVCSSCNEFYKYAEKNREDGTMVCWQCRTYPHYQ